MRPIKFRSWNPLSANMAYSNSYRGLSSFFTYCDDVDLVEGFDIMLYSGIDDKDGREIYEGDITNNGIIRFGRYDDSYVGFYLEDVEWCTKGGRKKHHDIHDLFAFTTPFEVRGNIYQNPELLK